MHGKLWIATYGLITASWVCLFALAREHPAPPVWGAFEGNGFLANWRAWCVAEPTDSRFATTAAMWVLMVGAMMLPSGLPFFRTYADLLVARANAIAHTEFSAVHVVSAGLGYLAVWLLFALLAAMSQTALHDATLMSPHGILLLPNAGAVVVLVVGLYQFSPHKRRAQAKCQEPFRYLLTTWQPGVRGGFAMGIRYGTRCLVCCWALMLLAFIGGTMNLLWMGVVTVVMVMEKMRGAGTWVRPIVGAVLIGIGAGVLLGNSW
ncbi:MAG: DUF2182 domain-containing protein [Pseudomonadota bacterium]